MREGRGVGDFALLCYPRNTPYSYDAHAPVSILALGTYLESRGTPVEYFDERVDPGRRLGELLSRKPRVVGVSAIGGYQLASAARLSRAARRLSPESWIVWGGIGPTILPEETAREDFVDCVVVGEGEETLLELHEALRAGSDAALRIPGTVLRDGSALRRNPPRPPPGLETLPFVYQGKAAGVLRRHLARGSVREAAGYEASRGCPFLCAFCYSPGFHPRTRVKSPDTVGRELEELRRLGVSEIDIYDDTLFGARRQDFPAYLERLRASGLAWIGNLRVNMVDEELLRRLEGSGCRWLYFGIESDDDEVLGRIDKGFTAEDVRRGLGVMRGSRIPAVYSIIYGLPLDGEASQWGRCLDFAERLHAGDPDAEVQVQSYVPLPGTGLYREALARGFKPPRRLLDWAEHDHFGVTNPWLEDPALANKLYISTFFAFRYRRHLSHFPARLLAYPLHRLSLWRVRRRRFGFYLERWVYEAALAVSRLLVGLRHALREWL